MHLDPASVTWVDEALGAGAPCVAQVSAHGRPLAAVWRRDRVRFERPHPPVAAGQTVVLYDAADPRSVRGRGWWPRRVRRRERRRGPAPLPETPADRAAELRRLIEFHTERYYVLDSPEISDADFGALVRELRTIEPDHPDLVTPDSPTQRVGGAAAVGLFAEVRHRIPMMSLDNAFDRAELAAWAERLRRQLPDVDLATVAFSTEPKVDGVAMSLTYVDGEFVQAATRGDGGDAVRTSTANVATIARTCPAGSTPRRGRTPTTSRCAARSTWPLPTSPSSTDGPRPRGPSCS